MRLLWKPCLFLLLLTLFSGPLLSLEPNREITRYIRELWDAEKGLPQNSVTSIVQTSDGYLWFGTQEGLVRYDGIYFKIYDKKNVAAFTGNFVTCLLEDREGNLLIGMTEGLVRWNPAKGRFFAYTWEPGIPRNVKTLKQDGKGNLWIGTKKGLYLLEKGQTTIVDYPPKGVFPDVLADQRINAFCIDSTGAHWVGTYGSGLYFKGNNGETAILSDTPQGCN